MEKLTDGLWRWTARHPEWHPGEFGAEVACFAAEADGTTLLIDPLLPADPGPVLETIDAARGNRLAILITIPYHVRDAEELWKRYRGDAETTIHGHRACAKRLSDRSGFEEVEPGAPLPGGVTAYTIGKPRRFEMPIHLPSHKALATGDALVTTLQGDLRIWHWRDRVDADRIRWYRERFNPTLQPLLDLDLERILVTHGPPIVSYGSAALQAAVDAEPWYHTGS